MGQQTLHHRPLLAEDQHKKATLTCSRYIHSSTSRITVVHACRKVDQHTQCSQSHLLPHVYMQAVVGPSQNAHSSPVCMSNRQCGHISSSNQLFICLIQLLNQLRMPMMVCHLRARSGTGPGIRPYTKQLHTRVKVRPPADQLGQGSAVVDRQAMQDLQPANTRACDCFVACIPVLLSYIVLSNFLISLSTMRVAISDR